MKKIFAALLLLCILLAPVQMFASSNEAEKLLEWEKAQVSQSNKLFDGKFLSLAGSSPSDWYAFCSAVGGFEDGTKYLSALKSFVEKLDIENETATNCQRIALTVAALGGDPTSFGTNENGEQIDLVKQGVYNRKDLGKQGINGYIWGLILLDSKNFLVPADAVNTKESIIEKILSSQLSDGGFSFDGSVCDKDITAMAITALSPHAEKVQQNIDKAVDYLKTVQESDGSFGSCESTAQVVIALCAIGKSPNEFEKNGNNVMAALMKYQNTDGGFFHSNEAKKSNGFSGSQALCALVAYERFCSEKGSLYNLQNYTAPKKERNLLPILATAFVGASALAAFAVILHKRRKK